MLKIDREIVVTESSNCVWANRSIDRAALRPLVLFPTFRGIIRWFVLCFNQSSGCDMPMQGESITGDDNYGHFLCCRFDLICKLLLDILILVKSIHMALTTKTSLSIESFFFLFFFKAISYWNCIKLIPAKFKASKLSLFFLFPIWSPSNFDSNHQLSKSWFIFLQHEVIRMRIIKILGENATCSLAHLHLNS